MAYYRKSCGCHSLYTCVDCNNQIERERRTSMNYEQRCLEDFYGREVYKNLHSSRSRIDEYDLYGYENKISQKELFDFIRKYSAPYCIKDKFFGYTKLQTNERWLDFTGSKLRNVSFSDCKVPYDYYDKYKGVQFQKCFLEHCYFMDSILGTIDFSNSTILSTNFANANCMRSKFINTNIDGISKFYTIQHSNVCIYHDEIVPDKGYESYGKKYKVNTKIIGFENCYLEYANFNMANICNITFANAYLKDADFIKAKLNNVNLTKSNLQGVNFSEAILNSVDFTGAFNLNKVNFSNAKLINCIGI